MRAWLVVLGILSSFPAYAAMELPARKAGLWHMTMSFEGGKIPPQTIDQCIDAATDKMMNSMGGTMQQQNCSKQDTQRVGNTIVVDSVCKFGAATNTTHAVVSGDFNSAYTVKVDSKRDGPARPGMSDSGASRMTIEAKYMGSCTAGQKPGDMMMGNGMKMNIREMPQMPGGMPGGAPPGGMPRR